MKKISVAFSILGIALAFSSCSKSSSTPANSASVMFVNGCNGATTVYAKANGTMVSAVSNLAFLSSSGYQSVTVGTSVPFAYYLTSTGTSLCSGTGTLTTGGNYTVFAGGVVTGPTYLFTSDDLTAPASGYAKVRFVNLSSDNLNETLSIGSVKVDSNVGANTCTPFFPVAAATAVGVLADDPAHVASSYLAQLSAQAFSSGKIYTIVLTGTNTGSGNSALKLTVLNNN